jgi:hypothetical protein
MEGAPMGRIRRGWHRTTTAAGLATITAIAGTIGLAASPAGAAGTVDQQQEQFRACFRTPTGFGQTFTAGRTGNLDQIDVLFVRDSGETSPYTVSIRTVSGGVPSDTVLASATVPAASVGYLIDVGGFALPLADPPQYVSVPIGPVAVNAGTQYAFAVSDGHPCTTGSLDPDAYAGGNVAFAFDGQSFVSAPPRDVAFRTYVSRFPTTLVANPSIVKLSGLKLYLTLSARLTSGGGGLAGRTVSFSAGNRPVCSAVTNGNGEAACGGLLPGTLASVLGLGYTATFDGDSLYAPSSAPGPLIG